MERTGRTKLVRQTEVDEGLRRHYVLLSEVGRGAYGTVWKALHRPSNTLVAVKRVNNAFDVQTDAKRTYREVHFLTIFRGHPNIVRLTNIQRAMNNRDLYLVFDFMDMDLHCYLKKGLKLNNKQIKFITFQLLLALQFLHAGNVVHRDLKPANVLVNRKCEAKLADFGLSRYVHHDDMSEPLTEYVATRWYRPPEILVSAKRYSTAVDMWALGCILAEMHIGSAIFPGESTIRQLELILSTVSVSSKSSQLSFLKSDGLGKTLYDWKPEKLYPLEDIMFDAPEDAVDLTALMLQVCPQQRITALAALSHPYVNEHYCGYSPVIRKFPKMSLDDEKAYSVDVYRRQIYKMIDHGKRLALNEKLQGDTAHGRRRSLIRTKSQPIPVPHKPTKAPLKQFTSETRFRNIVGESSANRVVLKDEWNAGRLPARRLMAQEPPARNHWSHKWLH